MCLRVDHRGQASYFFFSSRRRHTRFDCDWSSDGALPIYRLNFHEGGNTYLYEVSADLRNLPDRTEAKPGPYAPSKGQYRLARDWSSEEAAPMAVVRASSDLRIDGSYVERDSSCMYRCDSSVFGTVGTVAYWLKPSFRPEMTGKPRTFFSTEAIGPGSFPLMNGQWFFASHHESSNPYHYWQGPWNPVCFVAGFSTVRRDPATGYSTGGVGRMTTSLNAGGEYKAPKYSPLKHHQWIHVAYTWDMVSKITNIHVNGREIATEVFEIHPGFSEASDWTSENAVFRLGEPSQTMEYASSLMHIWWGVPVEGSWTISRNWSADATMDELYLWKQNYLAQADQLYDKGRYYLPRPGREGIFTSQPIFGDMPFGEKLAPASSALAPVVTGPEDRSRRTSSTGTTTERGPDGISILAAFWTWYPELVDTSQGQPRITDGYSGNEIDVNVTLRFLLDGAPAGDVLTDDGGSGIDDLVVLPKQKFQYQLKVVVPKAGGGSLITTTPAIDDVTLFYTRSRQYLHFGHLESIP